MNNDELATRRAQAIAEDRCFSKGRLRDEFRMKPAPGAEPVKWYKNSYGGRFPDLQEQTGNKICYKNDDHQRCSRLTGR